jgi:type I restriction enzyme M protein
MSPKGGIKPHKRFSIQAKRSEVLFVDYMAEHLTPTGRAGIIVPEGIIFQSQTAYTALRRMLVENSLVAVVSLPAGCFNPYSGVKTSILFLDKSLAKQSNSIAFFKVENDGFGLGAQRRAFDKNDLPQVKAELGAYLHALRVGQPPDDLPLALGIIVPKEKISGTGDYNLSGERYRELAANIGLKWPLVPIGELCVVERGASPRPIHDFITDKPDGVNWIKIGDAEVGSKYITSTKERVTPEGAARSRHVKPGDFVLSNSMSFGRPYVMATDGCIHDGWLLLRDQSDRLDQDFLYNILGSKGVLAQFERAATGGVVSNLNSALVRNVQIPLPPLEVQKEIVAEIESYQKVIDGARAVLEHYRPHIPIDPEWPIVELGEICSFKNGLNFNKDSSGHSVKIIGVSDFQNNLYAPLANLDEVHLNAPLDDDYLVKEGDILFVRSNGNPNLVGRSIIVPPHSERITFSGFTIRGRIEDVRALPLFFAHFFKSRDFAEMIKTVGRGANIRNLSQGILNELKVPLPPLATQQAIVDEIEAEQELVAANRKLMSRFEKKIQDNLARIWGEETDLKTFKP